MVQCKERVLERQERSEVARAAFECLGGQSATKVRPPEPSWQIEDEVVAPDVPGHLLQWRWVRIASMLVAAPPCLVTTIAYLSDACSHRWPDPILRPT